MILAHAEAAKNTNIATENDDIVSADTNPRALLFAGYREQQRAPDL